MLVRSLVALAALFSLGQAIAAEDKWEITTTFEMAGMPFAMPPQKQMLCLPQGQPVNEKMVPAKSDCQVSNFRTSGATSRFHIECPPPEQMSGDGEFTSLGKDGYKGQMAVSANMEGQQMNMKMSFNGKRLGACTASDNAYRPAVQKQQVEQMLQQQQTQQNAMCEQMYSGLAYQAEASMGMMCPDFRKNMCARAKAKFESAAANSDEMVAFQEDRRDWRDIGNYCGFDASPYTKSACASAKKVSNWNNAVLLCGDDPELAAVAKSKCTGMKFTSPQGQAWRPLCEKYAAAAPSAGTGGGSSGGMIQKATEAVDTGASAVDTGTKAMDTYKKFKGLFGR